jgi:quercetin dioxygenase-like cupin family protein
MAMACVMCALGLTCKDDGKAPTESTRSAPLTREPGHPSEPRREPRAATNADTELPAPVLADPASVTWMPGPPALPKGAQVAVLEGTAPFPAGKTFSLLLRFPPGYAIPPHTHPTTERVTVLQGRLRFGHGVVFDEDAATVVEPGGLVRVPAGHVHYAFTTDEEAIISLHGIGPWDVYYVDPAEDPRQPPPEKPPIRTSPLDAEMRSSIIAAKDVEFVEPPAGMLPDGAKIAVLEGDPSKPKTFVMRVKMPDGFRMPVHSLGITDRFDVVQGELMFAIGDRHDHQALRSYGPGSVIIVPRGVEHYAQAHGETVIQVFGVGPYDISWSDPAEAPRMTN